MTLRRVVQRLTRVPKEGAADIETRGHREYVGGLWDEVGRLQFDFLVAQGLAPHQTLVDIACGSLRGGLWFIPYLDSGNYLGIEKEGELIQRGLALELSPEMAAAKRPEFVISEKFEFDRFSKHPDYGIAQSLFTHLTMSSIELCLGNLRRFSSCRLFATFLEVGKPVANRNTSHAHRGFRYTQRQMSDVARHTGWSTNYIGEWGHPRGQRMLEFVPS